MTSDDNKKPFDEITRLLREVPQSGLPEYQIAGLETYLRAVIEFIGRIIENNNILHQIQSVEQTSDIQEYVKSLVQTIKAVKGVENAIARDRILEMREAGELLDLYPIITAMLEDHTYENSGSNHAGTGSQGRRIKIGFSDNRVAVIKVEEAIK
jgi:hypothetical protein